MEKNTIIYIVRHGESEANVSGVVSGSLDTPLTEEGEKQARKRGKEFASINFDAVFSSDLIRAKRTAELITFERKLAVVTKQALREINFGKLEGKAHQALHDILNKWRKEYKQNLVTDADFKKRRVDEDAENDEEITGRVITFLREVAVGFSGKTILIVSHGGVMHSLLRHFGIAKHHQHVRVTNTGYIKLESDGVDFWVKEMVGIETQEVE